MSSVRPFDVRVSRALGLAVLGASVVAIALSVGRASPTRPRRRAAPPPPVAGLRGAAAMLALSVCTDSALEHSRDGFSNKGMIAPVGVAALVAAANLAALGGRVAPGAGGLHGTALALGGAGTAFHAWNVLHRPGGLSWQNVFYAAPLGAPAALALAGLIGLAADHINVPPGEPPTLAGLPAGRALAALVAAGLAGTSVEVALMHFRGSFQSPYMWLPVTLPPLAAVLLAIPAAREGSHVGPARTALVATAVLGFAGVGFHARGIARMMGGWRNWSQNLFDGPPLPAPPAFTALALAGLAALALVERDHG